MLTLAEAFQEILDTPPRRRLLLATQAAHGNCHWLPAYIGREGELCCEHGDDANIELEEEAVDAMRLFESGSLSSCALVARLGDLGVGALVMGPESPSDAMRMLEQLKANALARFVEHYLADLQRRRPARVYPFKPR